MRVVAASGVVVPEPVGRTPEAVVGMYSLVDRLVDSVLPVMSHLNKIRLDQLVRHFFEKLTSLGIEVEKIEDK